jgi:hypothetical protein
MKADKSLVPTKNVIHAFKEAETTALQIDPDKNAEMIKSEARNCYPNGPKI